MPNWTPDQKKAIETDNCSLVVSAAAGSGKTAVLIERLIRLLSDPEKKIHAEKLCVVTFTNAAAAEIKERLRFALRQKAHEFSGNNENEKYEWLQKQQTGLHDASVSTIHSFCFSLLRNYMHDDVITSDFKVADESDAALMKKQAANTVINKFNKNFRKEADFLFRTLCSGNDNKLDEIIIAFDNFLSSVAFRDLWFSNVIKNYSGDFEKSEYKKSVDEYFHEQAYQYIDVMKRKCERCCDIAGKDDYNKDLDNYKLICKQIDSGERADKFKSTTVRLGDKSLTEEVNKFRTYKKDIDKITNDYNDYIDHGKEDFETQKKVLSEIYKLYKMYREELWNEKREKNMLTFDDAEEQVIKIICTVDDNGIVHKTDMCKQISEQYDLFMIDEYQDSNDRQDIIFKLLSKDSIDGKIKDELKYGNNVFIVGDKKQSIYSFRMARPENFDRAINSATVVLDKKNNNNIIQKIYLNANFRSSNAVCDTVNDIFENLMSKKCGGVNYNENEMLFKTCTAFDNAKSEELKTEFICVNDENNNISVEDAVANKIKQIIDNHVIVYDKQGIPHECNYSDISILVRNNKSARNYMDVLLKKGIPVFGNDDEGYLQTREISVLLNILRIINNPHNDVAFASVLMSPIVAFSSDDMLKLKSHDRYKHIYKCILEYAQDNTEEFGKKCRSFLDMFNILRKNASVLGLTDLIQKIYEETDCISLFQNYSDGIRKRENLRLLIHYASGYTESAGEGASVGGFLRYIDNIGESKLNFKQGRSSITDNAVIVQTIHKSKGLEYPFVILTDLEKKFSTQDSKKKIQLDENFVGFNLVDNKYSVKYKTAMYNVILNKKFEKQRSEEMRVLYVALTRARQKLFLFLSDSKKNKDLSDNPSEAQSYADWIWMYYNVSDRKKTENYLEFKKIDNIDDFEDNKITENKNIKNIADDNICRDIEKKLKSASEIKYTETEARITASGLTEQDSKINININNINKKWNRPQFMFERGKLTSNERGTAVHNLFQYLDYDKANENIQDEKKRLVRNGFILQKQADAVPDKYIKDFINSDLCKRMCEPVNRKIYRETEILIKVSDILKFENLDFIKKYKNTETMMKAIIDLYFEDINNNIIIVDYKTDKVQTEQQLVERYTEQLLIYKASLECITNKKINELYLWSCYLGKAIKIK